MTTYYTKDVIIYDDNKDFLFLLSLHFYEWEKY